MFTVYIRNNETREVAEITFTAKWLYREHYYLWSQGNYSCDCNRQLLFERAKGNEPDWDMAMCGESKYTVLKIIAEDAIVYAEDTHKD